MPLDPKPSPQPEPVSPPATFTFEGGGEIRRTIQIGDCELLFVTLSLPSGPAHEVRARFPDGAELILAAAGRV